MKEQDFKLSKKRKNKIRIKRKKSGKNGSKSKNIDITKNIEIRKLMITMIINVTNFIMLMMTNQLYLMHQNSLCTKAKNENLNAQKNTMDNCNYKTSGEIIISGGAVSSPQFIIIIWYGCYTHHITKRNTINE